MSLSMSDSFVIDKIDSQWVCDLNESVRSSYLKNNNINDDDDDEEEENEYYKTYFGVTYDEKILDSKNLVVDVEKTLSEFLPDAMIFSRKDSNGRKILEYCIDNNNDDKVYEIYKEFHKRLRIFVLFYIEAESYIEEDIDHWENLVGFCTLYLFYYLPRYKKNRENNENNHGNHSNENFGDCEKNKRHLLQITNNQDVPILDNIRLQISQFIILPHYQQEKLYQTIYQYCLIDSRIRQLVEK
ncbi:hypothetical protein Glove_114g160 [Diversispora epigaea]|uniref:Histone acetyltransferase type B catalytic subunit n=1 Tax=Diversispora epigaea TaxID=1348612 RepID=A0A397J7Y1_9GLOM|nr:hypothetical protein Glove_114g160 [Diversispora epigaea]